jgi:dolichol-phosphate mannosyltransferase
MILMISYCTFFHYSTLGLPGVPFKDNIFLFGWDNLAKEVEAISQRVVDQIGTRPVVVGMDPYQISSGLAFYRAKLHRGDREKQQAAIDSTLGWHLFGWKGLMYEFWAKPEDYYGHAIIAIGSSKVRVEKPYFQKRFVQIHSIQ